MAGLETEILATTQHALISAINFSSVRLLPHRALPLPITVHGELNELFPRQK